MLAAFAIAVATPVEGPPSGSLLLAGGGGTSDGMVRRFFREIGGRDKPILVVSLMREDARRAGRESAEFLRHHGAERVEVFADVELAPADRSALRERVREAAGIWLPGGDQGLFLRRVGADFGRRVFGEAVSRGACVFGTSAGAMLMSDPMIDGLLDDGRPKRSPGLGLVPFLVDTHYRERKRQGRLRHALEGWRAHDRAVGLSEGEWILWRRGTVVESEGSPEWLEKGARPGGGSRRDRGIGDRIPYAQRGALHRRARRTAMGRAASTLAMSAAYRQPCAPSPPRPPRSPARGSTVHPSQESATASSSDSLKRPTARPAIDRVRKPPRRISGSPGLIPTQQIFGDLFTDPIQRFVVADGVFEIAALPDRHAARPATFVDPPGGERFERQNDFRQRRGGFQTRPYVRTRP